MDFFFDLAILEVSPLVMVSYDLSAVSPTLFGWQVTGGGNAKFGLTTTADVALVDGP